MTNSLVMKASRNCSRCGQELTDAASLECGTGPICRKLDNKLLAKVIPANPAVAKGAWSKIDLLAMPPETVATMVAIDPKVVSMPAVDDDTFGTDWRETVKRIEWVLSHKVSHTARGHLYAFVEALGYAGLVSMWLGEAASGACKVTFLDGRLWMQGPRNKAGQTAIKMIPGRKFHPAAGSEKARWSVPASSWAAFEMAVLKHWPNNEGLEAAVGFAVNYYDPAVVAAKIEMAEAEMVAQEILAGQAPKVAIPEPKCWVTVDGDNLSVRTPWNGGFVAKLKTLPYKQRSWNPTAKCWVVKAAHGDFVKSLVKEFFNEEVSF